ncbi:MULTISPECIES: flagellar motor protein MotB [Bosea]|uniref:flagellar motor protein MotB n=1 Tax=Bosea TaxID=85413 RepID=UPI00214F97AB|nr:MULTISPECIES: flagellar motor protein MotB [Bosea]MCR4521454.1 OmpA family protein [Bosea sp. 47.2.35]MDR6829198.1 chemotaxis protein MotB [Bosea robiniae]MDR6896286.1 chemotaxis protein MotB [Bosea sp. BE109]MDR7139479.1 chemotaxis protein MotB [Bosea sp. BE168]MDR7176381.1 chemotaxis protein MotB [Bosea sp. BE271]
MDKPIQPIIIKKVKKAGHAHHGGAWKIAYADFVTAMMAFFLLMWLISMTTQEQKEGLAEYFAPAALSPTNSGAGGVLMGSALDKSGNRSSVPRDAARGITGQDDKARPTNSGGASDREVSRRAPSVQANYSAIASLRQALQNMPEIAELSRNIVIEQTKEGLNVSLVDDNGRSMFPDGSVQPYERTRLVLEALAPTIRRMPNSLSVTGHTAAARPGSVQAVDSWSLTAGRALAVREILSAAGLPNDRFTSVVGRADTEPLFPDNPYIPPNRRVTITLLNAEPPLPPGVFP